MSKYIKNRNIFFPINSKSDLYESITCYSKAHKKIRFKDHHNKIHFGNIIGYKNKWKILDCFKCKFIHSIPIPNEKKLKNFYTKKFYNLKRKKNYFKNGIENKKWWNKLYTQRLILFEKLLKKKGKLLDVGSGPGFFLAEAKKRGWNVKGIEPSIDAINFSHSIGVKEAIRGDIDDLNNFKEKFDLIYVNGVMEHLPNPKKFIEIANKILVKNGLLFFWVANDFNFFQYLSLSKVKKPWWIIPPEHINYFQTESLKKLFDKKKFNLEYFNTTFPMELFILMGKNYIRFSKLGKESQKMRQTFEMNFDNTNCLQKFYQNFSKQNLGRAIEIIVRKKT